MYIGLYDVGPLCMRACECMGVCVFVVLVCRFSRNMCFILQGKLDKEDILIEVLFTRSHKDLADAKQTYHLRKHIILANTYSLLC